MTEKDHFDECRGKHCARLGLYHPVYCCNVDEDIYCSQRYYYEGDDKILLEHNPYCKPLWGALRHYELKADGTREKS